MTTHQHKRDLRARIADHMRAAKESVIDTASRFGVKPETVKRACREHSVTLPDRRGPAKTLDIVSALIRGEPHASIAARLNVTRQAVHDVKIRCREADIVIPERTT